MSNIINVTQSNAPVYTNGKELTQVQPKESNLELKNGSSIQGTIMSISEGEEGQVVTINVGDNVLSARLSQEMSLREGQTLQFSVRSSASGNVSITPLYENVSADQSTLKALTAAGIEINNETVKMVKDMMSASLPIDKNSLLEMNRNLSAFPNTSIETLVEMKSLNIPITGNNITQYESYKKYEHQVVNEMRTIMDELPNAFSELVENGESGKAVNLYGSVLKLFAEGAQTAESANMEETAAGESALTTPVKENLEAAAKEAINLALKGNSKESIKESAGDVISKGNLQNFENSLRNVGVSENTIKTIMDTAGKEGLNGKNQATLFKELATLFENADMSEPVTSASWKKLFSDNNYNKLLKDTMEDQWLLKPDDVEKKENIDNLYQRLGNQAKVLSDAANSALGAGNKLSQSASNLSNNIDFMNQINQMFQYIQLPLQMTGQDVHGDLYVYKNKHKKMSEDGSVSAILHLDMENLGPLDVYVKMIEKKVTTNFYVADESVLDLINDNIHILNERLEKRGYTMTANMMLHDDLSGEDAAVDEMLNVNKVPILSTASFDARA